jgi:sulfatase maturation enzyme AslB (radical SAM superfamily)
MGQSFSALVAYRNHCIERFGGNPRGFVAWNGGEPTLLPNTYAEQVLDLQNQVLGKTAHDGGVYLNAAVTNLYSRNATLKLMIKRNFMFSVSLDGVPGARVDRAERDSEARVLRNLEWVIAQGGTCGVSIVVGRHNFEHLNEIYDRLDGIGLSWLRLGAMTPPHRTKRPESICALAMTKLLWR